MKPPHNPDLAALLRRADPAKGAAGIHPELFATQVRARIRAAEAEEAGLKRHWTSHFLPLAAALALLASLSAGAVAAHARQERARNELFASAYARSIDPWLMHASADRP